MSDINQYKTRDELLTIVPEQSVFLEIGVFRGEFAKTIIKTINPKELYLVDIWTGKWGSGDKDGENYLSIDNMENVYLGLYHQTKNKPNIHVIRSSSTLFLESCEDDFFDAIYVDGDHEQQAVYDDLVNSYKKIKSNGILMGHDYHHQIKVAVDQFCADFNQTISYITDDGCPTFLIYIKK